MLSFVYSICDMDIGTASWFAVNGVVCLFIFLGWGRGDSISNRVDNIVSALSNLVSL